MTNTDQCLRSFATYLLLHHRDISRVRDIGRAHVEGYKLWLAARPGRSGTPRATPPPWLTGWERCGCSSYASMNGAGTTPRPGCRCSPATSRSNTTHSPKPSTTRPRPGSSLPPRPTSDNSSALTVEFLLRTGLRVGEFTALAADAVVLIGDTHWLHVPVGKLHEDRYLPLHPRLVDLVTNYRAAHVPDGHRLLLPRENGKSIDRHMVTRFINKAGAAAGLGHIHPHQLRHTLATQAINRGMSLEAIAAMLGHKSMDMTLVYAKIANRTVAEEYFTVAEKVDALYARPAELPADDLGPNMARLNREHSRMLGNGYCTRPQSHGLHLRDDLRVLHLLPDHHRVPPHPARPTRRRLRQGPDPPRRDLRQPAHRPRHARSLLTTDTHIMPMSGRAWRYPDGWGVTQVTTPFFAYFADRSVK